MLLNLKIKFELGSNDRDNLDIPMPSKPLTIRFALISGKIDLKQNPQEKIVYVICDEPYKRTNLKSDVYLLYF